MLEKLWKELQRAKTNGAPDGCTGIMEVPFGIKRDWFEREFRLLISGWYHPEASETIIPFGTVELALQNLSQAYIKRHHLSCCAGQKPGAPDSALSLWYSKDGKRHWMALPGINYRI